VPQLGLIALLVAELVYLTVRFDSQALDRASSPWLQLVAWSPQFLQIAITASIALLVLQRSRFAVRLPLQSRAASGLSRSSRTRLPHPSGRALSSRLRTVVFDPASFADGIRPLGVAGFAWADRPGRLGTALVSRRIQLALVACGVAGLARPKAGSPDVSLKRSASLPARSGGLACRAVHPQVRAFERLIPEPTSAFARAMLGTKVSASSSFRAALSPSSGSGLAPVLLIRRRDGSQRGAHCPADRHRSVAGGRSRWAGSFAGRLLTFTRRAHPSLLNRGGFFRNGTERAVEPETDPGATNPTRDVRPCAPTHSRRPRLINRVIAAM
jgi:hypothetical protein